MIKPKTSSGIHLSSKDGDKEEKNVFGLAVEDLSECTSKNINRFFLT